MQYVISHFIISYSPRQCLINQLSKMVFVEPQVLCEKHPDQKQQPGVCSCCLRERLIILSSNSTTPTISTISSSCTYSSLSSSTYSSTCDSPCGGRARGHRRITSDVVGPFSFIGIMGADAGGGLKKSRSIAFVAREKKNKQGFWSRLMRSTGKRSKRVINLVR
ncbi:hypothetical protein P3L10_015927 [Capsicum annuum]|uniref:uncharacterized protein LOC107871973 n=1 Tax=Capsicum annuum TaxID=4072 RepID=UPI001FB16D8A|nr:uncharacterized protein LOC107871973 [Capsicum annuum]